MRTRSQTRSKDSVVASRKRKPGDESVARNDGVKRKQQKVRTRRESSHQDSSADTEIADHLCSASLAFGKADHGPIKKKASKKQGTKMANGILPTQGVALKSCNSVFERNSNTQATAAQAHEVHLQEHNIFNHDYSIQHHNDCQDIEGTAISPQKLPVAHFQSSKDHNYEALPIPTQEATGKNSQFSRRKRKGTSLHSDRARKNSSHSGPQTDFKRTNKVHSCPSTELNKQMKNRRRANSLPMQQKSSSPSRKRMNAAKLRWKHLAQSILFGRTSPRNTSANNKLQVPPCGDASGIKEQTDCVENRQSNERQSLRKKRKTSAGRDGLLLTSRQRLAVTKQQRKLHKHQHRLLRWMKTWLTQAKFSQITKDENSNDVEEFIMTEDQRNAFVQTMVKSCQHNPNMRTLFLDSVRILTTSGLMHAAASTVLQEESCEQAQSVLNAWATFQEQDAATKKVPLNILNAVNQLHETRGDLSTKLNTLENSYELKQLDKKTWKFKLPNLSMEDTSSSLPVIKENLGQDDIPV